MTQCNKVRFTSVLYYPLVPTNYLLAPKLEPEAGMYTVLNESHLAMPLCTCPGYSVQTICPAPHFTSQLLSQWVKTSPPRPFPFLAFLRHAHFHQKHLDCPEISGIEGLWLGSIQHGGCQRHELNNILWKSLSWAQALLSKIYNKQFT
jgi:hypothetical protein